jgi:hypothetical protein
VLYPRPKFNFKGKEVIPTNVGYFCGNMDGVIRGVVSVMYLNSTTGVITGRNDEVDVEDEESVF